MLSFVRTLRFKLVLLYLIVFGVIQVGLAALVLDTCERELRRSLDQRLLSTANSMLEVIDATSEEEGAVEYPPAKSPILDPLGFVDCYYQLLAKDNSVIERSASLRGADLSLDEAPLSPRRAGFAMATLRGEAVEPLVGEGQELRVVSVRQKRPPSLGLQVGVSLAPVTQSLAVLRRVFLTLIPVGLVAAGAAAWLLARRSLSPIGAIARRARELTAERLDERINVPRGRDELTEMVVTINGMLDRLERAFKAHERFIADAAHELKTPITLLLGQAQVLGQKLRSSQEYDRFIADLQGELRQLAQIVESLLTLTRADAGFPLSHAAAASVNDLVMDAVERCQPHGRQKGIRLVPTLVMPTPGRPDPCVTGDAELLRTMVINLVRNAIRHSPVGDVVNVEANRNDSEIYLVVRDHGPGIPEEHMPRIFDRFYRVPRTGDVGAGTGLGLAIAKGVAKLHRGEISVANRAGGGCEFVVRLPLESSRAGLSQEVFRYG